MTSFEVDSCVASSVIHPHPNHTNDSTNVGDVDIEGVYRHPSFTCPCTTLLLIESGKFHPTYHFSCRPTTHDRGPGIFHRRPHGPFLSGVGKQVKTDVCRKCDETVRTKE